MLHAIHAASKASGRKQRHPHTIQSNVTGLSNVSEADAGCSTATGSTLKVSHCHHACRSTATPDVRPIDQHQRSPADEGWGAHTTLNPLIPTSQKPLIPTSQTDTRTSFSPMWPGPSAMKRRSQHSDMQQPPAGHAPRMAASVSSGVRYRRARNWLDTIQNSRYLCQHRRAAEDVGARCAASAVIPLHCPKAYNGTAGRQTQAAPSTTTVCLKRVAGDLSKDVPGA